MLKVFLDLARRALIAFPIFVLLCLGSSAIITSVLYENQRVYLLVLLAGLSVSLAISWWIASYIVRPHPTKPNLEIIPTHRLNLPSTSPLNRAALRPAAENSPTATRSTSGNKPSDHLTHLYILIFVASVFMGIMMISSLPGDTRRMLRILVLAGPLGAMAIQWVLVVVWIILIHFIPQWKQEPAPPRTHFRIMLIYGSLCMYIDARLAAAAEPFPVFIAGSLFMFVWVMILGGFVLERSSEGSDRAFFSGALVGALVTGLAVLVFG